jgi:hypothetical protein
VQYEDLLGSNELADISLPLPARTEELLAFVYAQGGDQRALEKLAIEIQGRTTFGLAANSQPYHRL